ncbi:MAG: hypothetical protein GX203_00495 [Acholeplasmataceae bacterium]|nr:hypothetical protein [Acholeplasmataceae bacterium]HOA63445.1 hypothetical protein [Bacilli bacterium]HQA19428.1 hypothetical protein [Bacilli bacterium]HQD92192.1 hypothetical protein [Bacilli bacterium]
MKVFIIFSIGIFSLIYNLIKYNFLSFLQEIDYFVLWNPIFHSSNGNFLVIFDMIIGLIFLINPYNMQKILLIFGV